MLQVREMALWVKALAGKPESPSTILRTHMMEPTLEKLSSDFHIVRSMLWCHERRESQGEEVEEIVKRHRQRRDVLFTSAKIPSQVAISSDPGTFRDSVCRPLHKPQECRHIDLQANKYKVRYIQTHTRMAFCYTTECIPIYLRGLWRACLMSSVSHV